MEAMEKGRMEELMKNREAFAQLAQSSDAQRLMALLKQQSGGVQEAARQAAAGDPGQLMTIMNQLMHTLGLAGALAVGVLVVASVVRLMTARRRPAP